MVLRLSVNRLISQLGIVSIVLFLQFTRSVAHSASTSSDASSSSLYRPSNTELVISITPQYYNLSTLPHRDNP